MAAAKKPVGERALTLHDHIKELRNRLFFVAIVFITVSAVAYNYKDFLIYWLLKPLGNEKLIYLNPAGGFSFIFQVTMYVGIAAAIPFLVYNLYKFVSPALPDSARKHSAAVMVSSLILLCIGVSFGYVFAIPGALNFLNNFAEGYILPSLTADSYLNFILAYTAGLGILFQLPLILLLIHWIHPLKPMKLLKFERYMILIAFVGAAMITPTPDIMNQCVIALPIILMYQAGLIAICISIMRAKKKERPPKLTRAQAKMLKKIDTLASKQPGELPERPSLTLKQAVIPLRTNVPTPTATAAALTTVTNDKRRKAVMDVIGPVKKKSSSVHPMTLSSTQSQPQLISPVAQFMDMVAPVNTTTPRGSIPSRPDRPMQYRSVPIKVPQRVAPRLRINNVTSIDGVSLLY